MNEKTLREIPKAQQKALARKFARLILHEGRTIAEVARQYNIKAHLPGYLMRKHGLGSVRLARARGGLPRFLLNDPKRRTPDDVLLMRRMGNTWTQIGVEFGVDPGSLWQTMKRWCLLNGRAWPVRPAKGGE